ncbi:MAG: hypothetical protein AAF533_17415, partial [Acidobacteriota bacterium]
MKAGSGEPAPNCHGEYRCSAMASEVRILNTSKVIPFLIEEDINVDELLRLKYRYLDLRRPSMR